MSFLVNALGFECYELTANCHQFAAFGARGPGMGGKTRGNPQTSQPKTKTESKPNETDKQQPQDGGGGGTGWKSGELTST